MSKFLQIQGEVEGVVDLAGNNVVFQRVWPEKIVNHCISQTQAKSFHKVLGLLIKIRPFFFNDLLEQDGNMAGNFPDHINLCLAFIDALIELFIQFDPVKDQNDDTFPVQVADIALDIVFHHLLDRIVQKVKLVLKVIVKSLPPNPALLHDLGNTDMVKAVFGHLIFKNLRDVQL